MSLNTYCASRLLNDIPYSCSKAPVKGFLADGVIVNRADVDFSSFTTVGGANSNTVSNFPLTAGHNGYAVKQPPVDPYTGSQVTMEQGTYMNTFTKEIHLLIMPPADVIGDALVEQIANGEFVVILRKKAVADTEYIIYGLDGGLKATEITQDYYDDDTKGAIAVTLTETDAPVFARFLNAGTVADTETLLASLITP